MSEEIKIIHEDNGSKGRYVGRIVGLPEAELTYSRASPTFIIIDHTGVPDELRGKGVGQALVRHAVEHARESGTKILPLCPFAKAQIARHPDWQDVLN